EPDAAAGELVGRKRRREAWLEEHRDELRLGQLLRFDGGREIVGDRRVADALEVDAAAVVFDGDRRARRAGADGDPDVARSRLTVLGADIRRFETVRDRVADEMD